MGKSDIEGVDVTVLERHMDERGYLAELFRVDIDQWLPLMAYASYTLPGKSRGPHEHKVQTDRMVLSGGGGSRLYLWDNRPGSKTFKVHQVVELIQMVMVVIPPGVVHGYKCESGGMGLMVINLPDRLYRGTAKLDEVDEIRWENVKENPFRMV